MECESYTTALRQRGLAFGTRPSPCQSLCNCLLQGWGRRVAPAWPRTTPWRRSSCELLAANTHSRWGMGTPAGRGDLDRAPRESPTYSIFMVRSTITATSHPATSTARCKGGNLAPKATGLRHSSTHPAACTHTFVTLRTHPAFHAGFVAILVTGIVSKEVISRPTELIAAKAVIVVITSHSDLILKVGNPRVLFQCLPLPAGVYHA